MPENTPEPWEYVLSHPQRPPSRHRLPPHPPPDPDDARPDPPLDPAELLATELIANAVLHTKGPAALRVRWSDGMLRIGAWDADPEPPRAPRDLTKPDTENRTRPRTRTGLHGRMGLAAVLPVRAPRQIRVV